MKDRIKYLLGISIVINIILVFSIVRLKHSRWEKQQVRKAEIKNNQRGSLLVDKKILYSDSTAILFSLGQSNSANSGQGTYECHNEVYNYANGDLYMAKEPLLGPNGEGCSVWTRLADMLIDSGFYKKVILIPIGIGGTSIDCWANGICNEKLTEALMYMQKDSIKLTHVIWHQGENDNIENTPKDVYKAKLEKILAQIRESNMNATVYVGVASFSPTVIDKFNGIDTTLQNAQIEFVRENPGTKPGANTDLINLAADRFDGVHFSKRGLDKFAKELYYKLTE